MSTLSGETSFSITVTGTDQCIASLRALPVELANGALVRAVKAAGAPVLQTMKDLCPVLYGFLRNGLATRAKRMRDGTSYVCAIGLLTDQPRIPIDTISRGKHRGNTKYAVPSRYIKGIEFGNSHMEAIPFMRPAAATEAVNAIDIFQSQIEIEIDKAVIKVAFPPAPAPSP